MGEEGRSSSHKLNITNDMINKIILSITLSIHSIGKNVTSLYHLSFLNPNVIPSITPLVYTEESFPSIYLQTYFTIKLILSVMSSLKVTCHRTILFFYSLFPATILKVYIERIFLSVFINGCKDGKFWR